MKHRNKKVREFAAGQPCTLRLPGICRNRTETSVWCHSPYIEDGRGMGEKSHDMLGCIGCFECHNALDSRDTNHDIPADTMRDYFHRAMKRSLIMLWEAGVKLW